MCDTELNAGIREPFRRSRRDRDSATRVARAPWILFGDAIRPCVDVHVNRFTERSFEIIREKLLSLESDFQGSRSFDVSLGETKLRFLARSLTRFAKRQVRVANNM